MLALSTSTFEALSRAARPMFLERVRRRLVLTFPHFLPCFPDAVQSQIVGNMLDRAASWNLTQQASLWSFCEAMVAHAANFDEVPEVRARFAEAEGRLDHDLPGLLADLPEALRDAARRTAARLPFFHVHALAAAEVTERTAAAIPLALHDRPEAARAQSAAQQAVGQAETLGLGSLTDAPLVVAACRSFWGGDFADAAWVRELWREPWNPAERLELLRLRLAGEFGRFV